MGVRGGGWGIWGGFVGSSGIIVMFILIRLMGQLIRYVRVNFSEIKKGKLMLILNSQFVLGLVEMVWMKTLLRK